MSRPRHHEGPHIRAAWVAYSTRYTWRKVPSDWGQLVFAARGAMTVATDSATWVVPPHQAVWIPAGVRHDVGVSAGAAMRMVYVSAALRRRLPVRSCVVNVSPLLRELLRRTMKLKTLDRHQREQRHLMDLLLDEIKALPVVPIDLPLPRDARALRAAKQVRETPDAAHRLADVARDAGASPRTLERQFKAETGLGFSAWRQRARLLRALQLLADDASVTSTALAVGYESTSAFVAAFRREIGTTPGRYFKQNGV